MSSDLCLYDCWFAFDIKMVICVVEQINHYRINDLYQFMKLVALDDRGLGAQNLWDKFVFLHLDIQFSLIDLYTVFVD